MHVPDHLINNTTEVLAVASAAAVVATVAFRPARRAQKALLERPERFGPQLATAGLVFALQMVNFPVAPGTSGHLFGGALATALLGPRRALLAVSSVVLAQALFFADGGVGAVGINLWLIAIVPVAVAALVSSTRAPWWAMAGVAAIVAPPLSALAFTAMYATGATGGAGVGEVATSMLGVHLLIGIGEAGLTLAVLGAVRLVGERGGVFDERPVWGAAVLSAAGLSLLASSQPDGLERVAGDVGFAITGSGSVLDGSPLADYAVSGVDGMLSGSLAGLIGIGLTCAVCAALLALARVGRTGHVGPGEPEAGERNELGRTGGGAGSTL